LICKITDIIAILAVIFGIAGSLAMGIMQVSSGLNSVMGIFPSNTVSAVILLVLFAFYIVAACSGIDKGIKILSNFNIGLALAILLFILFLGPTKFILEIFLTTLGDYFTSLPSMSFRLFPYQDLSNWSATWTLTYLIWWVAWGPFVGIFIARISRGRTIRQFVLGVIMFPTIFSLLWFSIFGGTAINIELFNGGGLADLIRENVSTALFAFFEYVPFSNTLSILALVLIFIFLVTSADSATFVAGMITSNGALNPSVQCKLVWGIIIAVLTAAALFSGGVAVAKAIAIIGAIPFTIVLSLQIVAFLLVVKTEKP
jgi:glycine betaine transporter